jgi:hypothetical protein
MRLNILRTPTLYLRQGSVPSFVRADDPPALADELAALRRRLLVRAGEQASA